VSSSHSTICVFTVFTVFTSLSVFTVLADVFTVLADVFDRAVSSCLRYERTNVCGLTGVASRRLVSHPVSHRGQHSACECSRGAPASRPAAVQSATGHLPPRPRPPQGRRVHVLEQLRTHHCGAQSASRSGAPSRRCRRRRCCFHCRRETCQCAGAAFAADAHWRARWPCVSARITGGCGCGRRNEC
jgi:hypothetical protein